MKFRTEIEVHQAGQTIAHSDPILTMGSCFAENISTLLKERFFNVLENPFGVLYNPLSISGALKLVMEQKRFDENDLIFHQEEWHSLWHHSTFSHHDPRICLQNINTQMEQAHHFLKKARWMIVTFGTSFVYFHKQRIMVVANCHKIPETQFERRLISIEEIVEEWRLTLNALKEFNPDLHIIFSVSPIRHLRDGLIANQQSKATLLLAVHRLIENCAHCYYFPAYEILMDDLRDYRFYAANMTHPNDQAVNYIWEKFQTMFFTAETQKIASQFYTLFKAVNHRPRNSSSPASQKFYQATLEKLEELASTFPYVNLSAAKEALLHRLHRKKS